MNSNGTERPALTWLKDYVSKNPGPKPPPVGPNSAIGAPSREATATSRSGMVVRSLDGRMVMGVERDGVFREISALGRN